MGITDMTEIGTRIMVTVERSSV
jgi:cell shape-determining protein MreC